MPKPFRPISLPDPLFLSLSSLSLSLSLKPAARSPTSHRRRCHSGPPSIQRRAKISLPPASRIPIRPIDGEANHTSLSSFSSPISPPDFIRQFHAAFKHHRPLSGTMQSNVSQASRVLVSQPDQSKSATASTSIAGNNVRKRSHTGAPVGVARLLNAVLDRRRMRRRIIQRIPRLPLLRSQEQKMQISVNTYGQDNHSRGRKFGFTVSWVTQP